MAGLKRQEAKLFTSRRPRALPHSRRPSGPPAKVSAPGQQTVCGPPFPHHHQLGLRLLLLQKPKWLTSQKTPITTWLAPSQWFVRKSREPTGQKLKSFFHYSSLPEYLKTWVFPSFGEIFSHKQWGMPGISTSSFLVVHPSPCTVTGMFS